MTTKYNKYKTPQDIPGWNPEEIVNRLRYSQIDKKRINIEAYEEYYQDSLKRSPGLDFNPDEELKNDYHYNAHVFMTILYSFLKSKPSNNDLIVMASWLRRLGFECERELIINRAEELKPNNWANLLEDGEFPRYKALAQLSLVNPKAEQLAMEVVEKKDEDWKYNRELSEKVYNCFKEEENE